MPDNTVRTAPAGLYIHIPFCLSKCLYCNFPSLPAPAEGLMGRYVEALCLEISRAAPECPREPKTVYLGGGTPTMLSERRLSRLFSSLHGAFRLSDHAEVTVEANPGTLDAAKARRLRDLGVNRVSLGVQSFDERFLRRLGRAHSANDVLSALRALRDADFRNISLDLIYGLPGQSLADWSDDVTKGIEAGPQHLSLYALSVEDGTPFAKESGRGQLDLPPDEAVVDMYRLTKEKLAAAGYEHYEISSWARPDFYSRHNSDCWRMVDYRGLGSAAHSFSRRPRPQRSANVEDPAAYISRLESGKSPRESEEEIQPSAYAGEALMLGLRLREGVSQESYRREHGDDPAVFFPEAMELGFRNGWLESRDGMLRLTDEGLLFSNEIFVHLF